jgi:putative transposase
MPRVARSIRAGVCYHVLNRGNGRQTIFHEAGDYDAFGRVLREGLSAYPGVDLFAWCLMPNHWHLVLCPRADDRVLGRLMGWVGVTHVRRNHEHYHTRGGGHLYQGRFKAFPVQPDDAHFLSVCRYVEANPRRARLVERAEDWPWTNRAARPRDEPDRPPVAAWPVDRPADWVERVNEPLPAELTADLRTSVNRGRPFGEADWVAATAERLGLTHTLRGPGRPRKGSNSRGPGSRNQ